MSLYYDKNKIKNSLTIENIYDLVDYLGGEPEYTNNGIISQTICHNPIGLGSRKLYYYTNAHLFYCYTGCMEPSFDIFELVIKSNKIEKNIELSLYDAILFVASFFGIEGEKQETKTPELKDWDLFKKYDIEKINNNKNNYTIQEYDKNILNNFLYPRILNWEKEGISYEVTKDNMIGFYPVTEQITIPHFDINNRLIGIRGRFLAIEDTDRYGKYRPLYINKILYNHPLGMNLYHLNKTKDNIKRMKVAIILESEKGCLQYQTFYGKENDISVACCGMNISDYQIELLESLEVRELIIGFDRQFKQIGDEEFIRLKNKIININNKYKNRMKITAIYDKDCILPYKASPTDVGKEIFELLLKKRIILS